MTERPPVGYGLPWWLDTSTFLSADETRELGERDLGDPLVCSRCTKQGRMLPWGGTQRAHIVRKMAGGRKKGTTGPTVRLCEPCHTELDGHSDLSLAVRRSNGEVVWLARDADGIVTEKATWYCGRLPVK